jgi:hypothetical protein
MGARPARVALAVLGAASIAGFTGFTGFAGHASPPAAAQRAEALDLALVAQDFVVAPNGVFHLEYELSGELPEPPATTTTTTTTPPRTTQPPPAGEEPAGPATAASTTAATATSTTAATTTTATGTTTSGGGAAVTLLVTALEPIELRSDVAVVLAGAPRPAVDSAEFDIDDVLSAGAGDNGAAGAQGRSRVVLDVPTASSGEVRGELALARAGLYPLRVELREGTRVLVRHVTFVERLATSDSGRVPRSTLNLSIVASIPDPGPDPDRLDLVESSARVTELAQLGETVTAPLTVAVPPVVAEALGADPALATRLRNALSGDEVLAAPQTQLDASSAVAAGQVEAFTRELREGEDVLRRMLPSTAIRRGGWLAADPLSAAAASMLRDLGVQLLVVPFETYLGLDSALSTEARSDLTDPTLLVAADLPDDGELPVLLVDPITELLTTERADDATPAEVAAHLFADLMAMRIQLGPDSRSLVLATPDLGIPDPDVLALVEGFVEAHPDVEFQALSFVPGNTGQFMVNGEWLRVSLPDTAGPDLSARVPAIDLVRLHVEHVATMLPTDDPRPPEWRAVLEQLISTGIDDDDVTRRLDAIEGELETIEQAIAPPAPFTFTLGGDSTTITLRIGNTSITPLQIGVRISGPSRLTFPVPDTEVVLAPEAITDVTIPIRARSNGTSQVNVELHTPSGSVIGEPITLTARVNALSGLGQLLTGAALLVLVTWWFSHFRRSRRNRLQVHSTRSRDGHPSNRARHRRPAAARARSTAAAATGAPGGPSVNGDDVSPDAAVARVSPEQTEG